MTIKVYSIVTNDEFEHTLQSGLVGAKAVAQYLGKSVPCVRKNLMNDHWSHLDDKKAVVDVDGTKAYIEKRKREAQKRAFMKDRTEYFKKYWSKRRGGTKRERKIS